MSLYIHQSPPKLTQSEVLAGWQPDLDTLMYEGV
jgi:hypothetical protein